MTPKKIRRCVIYVRLSVTQEASVSIERQIEAAEAYAAQQGWTVVATFTDDGVSASKNRPEDRKGWRELMECKQPWDVVIVWKLDRLVRRIVHFWDTYKWLDEQGKSLVSVVDRLDMTTTVGRMVAGLLAGFAEMEAEAISTRVTAARNFLIRNGRVVGGTVPYGWRSVPNPDGPGFVLEKDPERIQWVEAMAERTLAGRTIYSTAQWLTEQGAPLPGASQAGRKQDGWVHSTVERMLRNPMLAGQIAHNPGNESKQRGSRVLIGEDGLPVRIDSLAVMTVPQWRAMVKSLDERDSPQSQPRHTRVTTSSMLSGLVLCGDCNVRMWRGTTQGRPGYYCPECHQSLTNFEHVVVAEFLRQKGERVRWSTVEEVTDGGEAIRAEVALRLDELNADLKATNDPERIKEIVDEIVRLKEIDAEAELMPSTVEHVPTRDARFFGEDWADATTDEERRDILGDALNSITVRRGRPGRRTDAQILERLDFDWKAPEDLGPVPDEA